jgi:hypothetical protein
LLRDDSVRFDAPAITVPLLASACRSLSAASGAPATSLRGVAASRCRRSLGFAGGAGARIGSQRAGKLSVHDHASVAGLGTLIDPGRRHRETIVIVVAWCASSLSEVGSNEDGSEDSALGGSPGLRISGPAHHAHPSADERCCPVIGAFLPTCRRKPWHLRVSAVVPDAQQRLFQNGHLTMGDGEAPMP